MAIRNKPAVHMYMQILCDHHYLSLGEIHRNGISELNGKYLFNFEDNWQSVC